MKDKMKSSGKKAPFKDVLLPLLFGAGGLALFLFIGTGMMIKKDKGKQTGPYRLIGYQAPDIDYADPSGTTQKLSERKGTAFLLNFWATWCQPCLDEMPSLKAFENHFSNKGLVLLAFNIGENGEGVKGKLKGKEFPRNLIYDFDRDTIRPYSIGSLPLSILVGRDGKVQQVFEGPRNWAEIDQIRAIEEAIK